MTPDPRRARLRDALDAALTNMMAVLPGADHEPGWELPTGEEGWNVRETLAHLAGAEVGLNRQIAEGIAACAAGAPAPVAPVGKDGEPFSLDRWNAAQVGKRSTLPASALRVELTETRAATLRQLAAASDTDLDAPAWTPALGSCTVEAIFKVMAVHMRDHTRAMKAALRASYGHYWGETESQGRE